MVIIIPIESGSSWSVWVYVHHIGHYLTGWSRWESLRATHVTEEETNSGGIPWALSISFPLTEGCHVPGGRDKGLPGFESCSGLVLWRCLQVAADIDRDKTGELWGEGTTKGGGHHNGRHQNYIETMESLGRSPEITTQVTSRGFERVPLQVSLKRWRHEKRDRKRRGWGPPWGKTNLDIHRAGEQSPPRETMPVINKGWQAGGYQ